MSRFNNIKFFVWINYLGKCLSEVYNSKYLDFKCKREHTFTLITKTVLRGVWCQKCINIDKLEELQKLSLANGCICLSDKYESSMDNFTWCCHKGHVWTSRIDHTKINWCVKCKKISENAKKSIDIKNKILRLLVKTDLKYPNINDKYWDTVSRKSKIRLICDKKHIINIPISSLLNIESYICKKCRGCDKHTIEEAKEIAKQRSGECLSDKYVNNVTNLLWKCHSGHEWPATLASVISAETWCPKCRINIGEEVTRTVFNAMFGVIFDKIRPKWLNGLELDGYNETLKLAFEYNGQQHYKFSKLYYKTEDDLKAQQTRDKQKNELCIKKKIKLITVPYTVKFYDIQQYIIDLCQKNNITIPFPKILDIATFKNLYISKSPQMIKFEEKVKEKGGKVIDKNPVYIHSRHKIQVECKRGHQWDISWDSLNQNKWCTKCPRKTKHTIKEMQELANNNNGVCLSTEYIGCSKKLLWKCNGCQKEWNAQPSNIINGFWCGNNCRKS